MSTSAAKFLAYETNTVFLIIPIGIVKDDTWSVKDLLKCTDGCLIKFEWNA